MSIAEDFAGTMYLVLRSEPKYAEYIERLITPSGEEKRKAEISSIAGQAVGHLLGIGWKTLSGAGISFKEKSPIWLITIKEHKDPEKRKLAFIFR